MKIKARTTLVLLGALVTALVTGGVVWFWQEREPAMRAAITVTDPSVAQLRSFRDTRVFFGHMSVGSNVIGGVGQTLAAVGESAPPVVETKESVTVGGGFLAHAQMGVNGEPYGKFADFVAVLDGSLGRQLDVAVFKLCYLDVVANTDVDALFRAYSSMMAGLERKYPSVRFVYTTVPLTTDRGWKATVKSWIGQDDQMGPADNVARQRYNELVRQRFASTGRLFDIAAVESTMSTAPMTRVEGGQTFYVLNGALASDAGHLNDLGSRIAATELIQLVAGITQ